MYSRRHVDFPLEFEIVYQQIFSLYLDRNLFQKLVDIALIRQYHAGDSLGNIGDNVTALTIILDGTFRQT